MKNTQNITSKKTVTNYDGITKQLLDNMDDRGMIEFINSTFGRNFSSDSSVTRLATETTDKETKQKRCDYFVKINDDFFLIEIQSYEDEEMALRIFEYGSRGAVLHSLENDGDTIDIQFPEPVVFYLRKEGKVHEKLSVRMRRSGSDETYNYAARVVYVEDYDLDGLMENNMLPLVPFYPMRYEKMLEKKHSSNDERKMLKDISECYEKLKAGMKSGRYGAEYFHYMTSSMVKVLEGMIKRIKKEGKIYNEKEAEEVMQRMTDEPIEMFDIFEAMKEMKEQGITEGLVKGKAEGRAEGIAKGRAEGRVEGINKGHLDTARNMLADGLPDEMILRYSGVTTEALIKLKAEKKDGI